MMDTKKMDNLDLTLRELRWLQFSFPWQDNAKDDADRMCNAIHKYVGDAIYLLEKQAKEIEKLREGDTHETI